ncbi:hypothetical protein GCM10011575_35810 [Microlunatus endophyticus]|uniref:Uncharacterized protein n=2 Tax=Microlunatus endophyticus TaxID=1716077 RepID=A0A917W7W7_9ACTN|nr:hypothetical protein GCM10011575_35810 [Microlunatus endophyticus]
MIPPRNKQSQSAGDNSTQIVVQGDYYAGITEERAREIARGLIRDALESFTVEARAEAERRIAAFDERLINLLAEQESLHAFREPSVQLLVAKAQKSAAGTERGDDYELLARLLEDRIERGSSRTVRAGIDRAVEIVDKLDDDALLGLTAFHTFLMLYPVSGSVNVGIGVMEKIASIFDWDRMPSDAGWLDHLDILDCVRTNQVGSLKKFIPFFSERVPGYFSHGTMANSEVFRDVARICGEHKVGIPITEHELKEGFVRFPATGLGAWSASIEQADVPVVVRGALVEAAKLLGVDEVDESTFGRFSELVDETAPMFRRAITWWDSIAGAVSVTSAGSVVARANAKRLDSSGVTSPLWN